MTEEQAKEKIRTYLGNLHATLWSDFDLSQPQRFEAAVEWLYTTIVKTGLFAPKVWELIRCD